MAAGTRPPMREVSAPALHEKRPEKERPEREDRKKEGDREREEDGRRNEEEREEERRKTEERGGGECSWKEEVGTHYIEESSEDWREGVRRPRLGEGGRWTWGSVVRDRQDYRTGWPRSALEEEEP